MPIRGSDPPFPPILGFRATSSYLVIRANRKSLERKRKEHCGSSNGEELQPAAQRVAHAGRRRAASEREFPVLGQRGQIVRRCRIGATDLRYSCDKSLRRDLKYCCAPSVSRLHDAVLTDTPSFLLGPITTVLNTLTRTQNCVGRFAWASDAYDARAMDRLRLGTPWQTDHGRNSLVTHLSRAGLVEPIRTFRCMVHET